MSPHTSITGCILARNEAHRIEEAIRCLEGWTAQIIVIDNSSDDDTAAIARRCGAHVVSAPLTPYFDGLRNLAIQHADGDWIFFLDADERVPPGLGPIILRLVRERGDQFEVLHFPFKHHFCGKWMQHSGWWPGYKGPQLLKKDCFRYRDRLHGGAATQGRVLFFPADDPNRAIVHLSYEDLGEYLAKLDRYTGTEALSLREDGHSHSWQAQIAHFVQDWQIYYDRGRADLDGMHGFLLAFMSGAYRWIARARLWDLRRTRGELLGPDPVPASLGEILDFMGHVAEHGAAPYLQPGAPPPVPDIERVPADWLTPREEFQGFAASLGQTGVTGCILARNEEVRIERALRSLRGWTDRVVVIDNDSQDRTAAIARELGAVVISAPPTPHFDVLRNLASEHAETDWIFVLDADECATEPLALAIVRWVRERGDEFDGLELPYRNCIFGRWLESPAWWPRYKGPLLLRKDRYRYLERLHAGAQVDGRVFRLPANDPEAAVLHFSHTDIGAYLAKLNTYTEVDAEHLDKEGASHAWQAQLADLIHDWSFHYDRGFAHRDGMHGFVLAFLGAFYRFAGRAKLWDRRRRRGETDDAEPVPGSLREMLAFMRHVSAEASSRLAQADLSYLLPGAPPAGSGAPAPLVWSGFLFVTHGYSDEARNLALALIEAGEPVALLPAEPLRREIGLPADQRRLLEERVVPPDTPAEVFVSHTLPSLVRPSEHAVVNVARTMFETEGLPEGWAERLNRMDRVWVPSAFNRDTFVRAGVHPEKIAIIPGCIDPAPFTAEVAPWPVPFLSAGPSSAREASAPNSQRPYTFLSVFDWTRHKGWDVLLEAFAREFGGEPGVALLLKVWSSMGRSLDSLRTEADRFLRDRLGRSLVEFPNIHLWHEVLPVSEVPRIYRAADAFVLPTRGEGWCRPLMEAMAAGLPTIATGWSGLTEFHDASVGYPIRYRLAPVPRDAIHEIPVFAGQRWAEPDGEHLRRLMRRVVTDRGEADEKGQAAQRVIQERFSRRAVAALLREELEGCRSLAASRLHNVRGGHSRHTQAAGPPAEPRRIILEQAVHWPAANPVPLDPVAAVDFRQALGRPLRVRWEGDQRLLSSLALVNREFCLQLLAAGDVELSLVEQATPWHTLTPRHDARFGPLFARLIAELSGPPDVVVRHYFPPNWLRPVGADMAGGKLVMIQPWEWSHLPGDDWLEGATRLADEVWAYSRFVRDTYVRTGVPAEKVRVVPLGVRTDLFTPKGRRYPLRTRKSVRFLFVGGALHRKGADLLLDAYLRAFSASDDVSLVVKDLGTRTFYAGQTWGEGFRRAQSAPGAPEIVYLDDDLSPQRLASLYRACTCVVLPHRGEGFALSPLEGMACGLPAIVTAGGATDDYLDDTMALRVPYHRRIEEGMYVGPLAVDPHPWLLEPDLDALVDALRWVRDHPDETQERGQRARDQVISGWTWERAAAVARARFAAVLELDCPRAAESPRLWAETQPVRSRACRRPLAARSEK